MLVCLNLLVLRFADDFFFASIAHEATVLLDLLAQDLAESSEPISKIAQHGNQGQVLSVSSRMLDFVGRFLVVPFSPSPITSIGFFSRHPYISGEFEHWTRENTRQTNHTLNTSDYKDTGLRYVAVGQVCDCTPNCKWVVSRPPPLNAVFYCGNKERNRSLHRAA